MKIDKYSAILGNTVGFHDMSTLTNHRPVASLPFGGKYRLIDFPLSNKIISVLSLTISVLDVNGGCLLF